MNLGFIVLAYIGLMALSFFDNGRGAAYPDILEHFKISTDMGSYLFSLVSLSGLFVNISSRWWLPITGLVGGTRFAMFCIGIGSFGVSYGAKLGNFPIALSFATVAGLGLGAFTIIMNILVAEGAPLKSRRRFLSGLHGVYGVSSFLAPQIINIFIFYGTNWIEFFQYISIVTGLVILYSFRVHDTHKESFKEAEKAYPIKLSSRLVIGLFMGLYVASEIVVSSRLSLYLSRALNFETVLANSYLSYFFIALMTGRLLFAFVNFKHDNRTLLLVGYSSSIICFLIGLFVYPLGLCAVGFTMSYIFPVSMDWLNEKFGSKTHIMLSSVMTTIGASLSFMHWGFGQLVEMIGVEKAFYGYLVLKVISLILFLFAEKIKVNLSESAEAIA